MPNGVAEQAFEATGVSLDDLGEEGDEYDERLLVAYARLSDW